MVGFKYAVPFLTLALIAATGCSRPGASTEVAPNKVAPTKVDSNTPIAKLDSSPKANPSKKPESPVKSFSFVPPSADWITDAPSTGDGTFTKASFKTGSNVKLTISSIGLPAKGKQAAELIKTCETGFAQGYAKHADQTHEWIAKGFSVSRFADSTAGTVSVWCLSNTCNVKLDFSFGSGSNVTENVKAADAATNAFFEANPTGGAVLK